MDDTIKSYAEQLAQYKDHQTLGFLERNGIKGTFKEVQEELDKKGYRVIEEHEVNADGSRTVTLTLTSVIDSHKYHVQALQFGESDAKQAEITE